MELARILRSVLSPASPQSGSKLASLHTLCIRTAAIYATTSLYEFHDKQKNLHLAAAAAAAADPGGHGQLQVIAQPQHPDSMVIQESMWEEVFPLLDQHFFQVCST
jgi:hypothetical protein